MRCWPPANAKSSASMWLRRLCISARSRSISASVGPAGAPLVVLKIPRIMLVRWLSDVVGRKRWSSCDVCPGGAKSGVEDVLPGVVRAAGL